MNTRGSVVGLGVFVFVLVLGLSLVFYGYSFAQAEEQALENAVEIDVEILETDIETRERTVDDDTHTDDTTGTRTETVYRPVVTFTYEFEGEQYRSSNIYPGGGTFQEYSSRSAAESDLSAYSEGSTATGYVDPDQPSEGFLIAEETGTPQMIMVIGGLFALIGLIGAGKSVL